MRSLLLLALLAPLAAAAQDRVRLYEVLPALEGSELGAIDLGAAPPPGTRRVVYRSEILAALERAHRDPRGLAIPARATVVRGARDLDADALRALAEPSLGEVLAPCAIESVNTPASTRVADGELEVRAEGAAPRASGTTPAVIVLVSSGREVRIPVQARVSCPAPVIAPGAHVRLLVRVGPVEASAPGIARQGGRIGDVVAVQNAQTRAALRARVRDAETVEVIP